MQLYAATENGKWVRSSHAERNKPYVCLECGGTVLLRGGFRRQSHFYHVRKASECRQGCKSAEHIATQLHLQKMFPTSLLEVPFGNRIADVHWKDQNIVFEVQCSPIDGAEVAARNADYKAHGQRVIWIFHEKRFNRRRRTAAEALLPANGLFYTDIDKEGRGRVYQQSAIVEKGVVIRRLSKQPFTLEPIEEIPSPKKSWKWPTYRGFLKLLLPMVIDR